ncbi:MAG: hypothetical protein JST54_05985 [Deltaproteobacteria bacterium]|nr:hypothetical protein [Deltaproteobacteria bacterium]
MRTAWPILLALTACATAPHASQPSSCLIRDENLQPMQCFDFVGPQSRAYGPQTCREMEGRPEYVPNLSCSDEGLVGSCTTGAGSDTEVVERCYRDPDECRARCKRHAGTFAPVAAAPSP